MFLDPVKRAVKEAKTDQRNITDLIIVGLLTKITSEVVQKLLKDFFPGSAAPSTLRRSWPPGPLSWPLASLPPTPRLSLGLVKVEKEKELSLTRTQL